MYTKIKAAIAAERMDDNEVSKEIVNFIYVPQFLQVGIRIFTGCVDYGFCNVYLQAVCGNRFAFRACKGRNDDGKLFVAVASKSHSLTLRKVLVDFRDSDSCFGVRRQHIGGKNRQTHAYRSNARPAHETSVRRVASYVAVNSMQRTCSGIG